MSTTTIRLPDELKARVAAAAKRAGTTTHSFILEAIAEKRYADIIGSGKTIPWRKMRTYMERRLAGKKPRRPKARKLVR